MGEVWLDSLQYWGMQRGCYGWHPHQYYIVAVAVSYVQPVLICLGDHGHCSKAHLSEINYGVIMELQSGATLLWALLFLGSPSVKLQVAQRMY